LVAAQNREFEMRSPGIAVVVFAVLAGAMPAGATTLVNADTKVHELRIESRAGGRALTVEPNQTVEALCPEGCTLTLVGLEDATYRLEGTEKVTIEAGGVVYYDGQLPKEQPEASDDGGAATAD
jgi:hypothetical protein